MAGACTTTSPPAAPTGVDAAADDAQVTISWTPVSGATSYNIYWSNTSGVTAATGTQIVGASQSPPIANSPYLHTGLTNGTAYYYVVTAVNSAGESVASAPEASATPAAPVVPPSAPTGVTATAGNGRITLSWTNVSGATSYNVYWSNTAGVTTATGTQIIGASQSPPISNSPYLHTGLTNGTTYYYVVTAVNSAGQSAASSPEASATPSTAPVTVYFADDFENGLGNWEVSGSDWALTGADCRSASHATDSPGGNYPPHWNATMTLLHSIDLSGSTAPVLSFWHKVATTYYGSGCDRAQVEISPDGGLTWTVFKSYCRTDATWRNDLVDLSGVKDSAIRVRFRLEGTAGGSDGWHIDDVVIKEKDTQQFSFPFSDHFDTLDNWEVSGCDWTLTDEDSRSASRSATVSPGVSYPPHWNAAMTLLHPINLFGTTAPLLSFWHKVATTYYGSGCDTARVEISMDGGLSWSPVDVFCQNSSTWTNELVDLSAYINSAIRIRFQFEGTAGGSDGWHIDDVVIKEKDAQQFSFPFSDHFDTLDNWEISGSDWTLTDADYRSASRSATDSPGGNYPPHWNATMTLLHPISLSGSTAPVLSFWYKAATTDYGSGCDTAQVEISPNGGFTWGVVKSYCQNVSTWTNDLVDLSSYKSSPIRIRFRLVGTAGGSDGWYIDDVGIAERP